LKKIFNICLQLLIFFTISYSQSIMFNHSKFDELLRVNVDENGRINYAAFENSKDFKDYLRSLEAADISELNTNDKLAFYINAYNATVIKNVLNHLPITSPMDIDGFFNKIKHKVAGKEMTLDELEHQRVLTIEPVLSHFGLVCAAISCPILINKAYEGATVYHQLEDNASLFLNDIQKNRLDKKNNILYLSELFKWFRKSFEDRFGSLVETAKHFLNEKDKIFLDENEVEIKFVPYNWQLNKQ